MLRKRSLPGLSSSPPTQFADPLGGRFESQRFTESVLGRLVDLLANHLTSSDEEALLSKINKIKGVTEVFVFASTMHEASPSFKLPHLPLLLPPVSKRKTSEQSVRVRMGSGHEINPDRICLLTAGRSCENQSHSSLTNFEGSLRSGGLPWLPPLLSQL